MSRLVTALAAVALVTMIVLSAAHAQSYLWHVVVSMEPADRKDKIVRRKVRYVSPFKPRKTFATMVRDDCKGKFRWTKHPGVIPKRLQESIIDTANGGKCIRKINLTITCNDCKR